MKKEQFEDNLIESLQPIRYFALGSSIYHLFESGIYDLIYDWYGIDSLANRLGFEKNKLTGFLLYLRNENIIIVKDGKTKLTNKGLALASARSWYTMFIGGYGDTFLKVGNKLKIGSGWAERDIVKVGLGSCGISYFDALPLTKALLSYLNTPPQSICDLGCGNGMYLTELYKLFGDIVLEGIEPNEESCVVARKFIESQELSNKITIHCNNAIDFVQHKLGSPPDVLILGFVLHEILAQNGDTGLLNFLINLKRHFSSTYIVVIEVDNQINNRVIMKHKLSEAYYNPYYLLHYFTNQRLEKADFWEETFKKSGLKIIAKESTDREIDSTGLEIGYLLK